MAEDLTSAKQEAAELLKSVDDARKQLRSEIWPLSISALLLLSANNAAAIVTGTGRAADVLFLIASAVIISAHALRQRRFGASMHPTTWVIAAVVFAVDVVAFQQLHGRAHSAWAIGIVGVGLVPMALANRAASTRRAIAA